MCRSCGLATLSTPSRHSPRHSHCNTLNADHRALFCFPPTPCLDLSSLVRLSIRSRQLTCTRTRALSVIFLSVNHLHPSYACPHSKHHVNQKHQAAPAPRHSTRNREAESAAGHDTIRAKTPRPHAASSRRSQAWSLRTSYAHVSLCSVLQRQHYSVSIHQ